MSMRSSDTVLQQKKR